MQPVAIAAARCHPRAARFRKCEAARRNDRQSPRRRQVEQLRFAGDERVVMLRDAGADDGAHRTGRDLPAAPRATRLAQQLATPRRTRSRPSRRLRASRPDAAGTPPSTPPHPHAPTPAHAPHAPTARTPPPGGPSPAATRSARPPAPHQRDPQDPAAASIVHRIAQPLDRPRSRYDTPTDMHTSHERQNPSGRATGEASGRSGHPTRTHVRLSIARSEMFTVAGVTLSPHSVSLGSDPSLGDSSWREQQRRFDAVQ